MPGPGYKRKSVRVSEAKDAAQAAVAYAQAAQAAQDAVTYAQAAQATSGAVGYAQAAQAAKTATTTPTPTLVNVVSSIMPDLSPAERLFAPAAIRAGARYNVSPALLMGLIEHESGFDPTYSGPKTPEGRARGATGFLPKTAEQYGVEFGTSKKAIQSQVDGAAKYLSELDVNNDPESALRKYGVGDAAYVKPVVKAARHYGPLEQVAAKAAWKFVKSPNDPTAPPRRAPADTERPAADAGQPSPVNTERPAPRRPVRRDPSAPDDGPVNTERPSPQQAIDPDVRRIVAGVKRRVGEIQSGDLQAAPSPQQKQRVRTRLQKAVRKTGDEMPADVPAQYRAIIARASRENGVPVGLLAAVLRQESGFQAHIGSPAGAQGIAQFMPGTAAGMGVDPNDPKSAIPGAAKLLKGNKDQFGSWKLALAAYNAGGGAVSQYGGIPPYAETQNYVKTIMSAWDGDKGTGGRVNPALIRKARETIGPLNTKAILKDVDLSPAKQVKDPARRAAVKRAMLGQATKADAKLLGPAATKALMDGGRIAEAKKGMRLPASFDREGKRKIAEKALLAVVPRSFWKYASGDSRTPGENSAVGGSATSDHLTTNVDAMAGDFSVPSDISEDQAWELARAVARKLGLPSETGLQTVDRGGVRYQLIWQAEGHYDHVHVGAQVIDPSDVPRVGPVGPKIKGTDLIVAPRIESASATGTTTGTTTGAVSATGGAGSLPGIGSTASGGGKGKQPREVALVDLASQLTPSARLPTARDPRATAEEEDPLVAAFRNFRPSR